MKIPSIIKPPRHNRFSFEPRYYDPIKEEIEEKFRAFRANKELNKNNRNTSSISDAFSKRQRKNSQSSAVQLIIALLLMATCVAWLFYGNQIFYVFLIVAPIYFYWRIKNRAHNS
jgi:Flp pilus assembly protein TadB